MSVLTPALSSRRGGIVRRVFGKASTGLAGHSSAKQEPTQGGFLSCPSSLRFDAIAPKSKAKAEGRGFKVRADNQTQIHAAQKMRPAQVALEK